MSPSRARVRGSGIDGLGFSGFGILSLGFWVIGLGLGGYSRGLNNNLYYFGGIGYY